MKPIIIFLVLALIIILVASIIHLFSSIQQLKIVIDIAVDPSTAAFDPALNQVPGFTEIEQRMSALIQAFRKRENSFTIWTVVLNLLVTIVTGLTALITAISTAKHKALTQNATILVASLTFMASLLSFGQSQLTTVKENARKKIEEVKKVREELESLQPNELIKELPVYNRNLDEM